MDERNKLLDELRIDRSIEPPRPQRRGAVIAGSCALALTAGLVGWWVQSRSNVPETRPVAEAHPTAAPQLSVPPPASALDATGYVVARRLATVASKTIGRVVELPIDEGQRVEKDQLLARLDDSNARAAVEEARAQIAQSEANLAAARIALEDARPIFARSELQRRGGLISAQQFDNDHAAFNAAGAAVAIRERGVELARASLNVALRNLDDTVVRAPFAGVVTARTVQIGEVVSPSSAGGGFTRTGIGTIVDMDSLEVEVDVSEKFVNRVHAGQPVTVRLNAYPDVPLAAQVLAVIPTADRSTATVKVRIGLTQRDARVLPDMGARVSFESSAGEVALNAG